MGVAVAALAAPILLKRGGVLARLRVDWSAIVGPEWAAWTWPAAFGREGALKLLSVPTAALELQHRAPLLIERINLYFGRSAVNRLVLVQAIPPFVSETDNRSPRSLDGDTGAFEDRLSGIADPALRGALGRLARAVSAVGD